MSRSHLGPRIAALAGLVAGLGPAPLLAPAAPAGVLALAALAAAAALALRSARSRVAALALAAALAGLGVGWARLEAIDAGAATPGEGARVAVRGFVEAVPRRSGGEVRVRVATSDGRLALFAPEPVPDLPPGREVAARGIVREPADWERPSLRRTGVARIVEARSIRLTGSRRGGLPYLTDRLRDRAERALSQGTPPASAALLRGFVLGQDDRIDAATVEDYQRSGLAHLLAVSGQNVVLLALLAMPLLALAGLGLRARLAAVIGLIALYVPVAGAGPSIQRAGVMGAAGIAAALASRPASRWYALLLAAGATLVLNPRASGDIGWQLSFAAVVGIAVWAAPLRRCLQGEAERGSVRAAVAEGVAITVAATVATAPLMAHHFDRLSVATLIANLLALPAVAPVMWLGMLAAAAGQVPLVPVEPLTGLAGVFAAYITQVAEWTAAPRWAQVDVGLPSAWSLAGVYALLAAGAWSLGRFAAARGALRPRPPPRAVAAAAGVVLAACLVAAAGPERATSGPAPGLTVRVLDVGQGDAILLQPRGSDPVLVDTGPASGGAVERLQQLGVRRLAAVLITHHQSDHAGGLAAILARFEVETVAFGAAEPTMAALARASGTAGDQVAAGSIIAAGPLELEVLWPPQALVDAAAPAGRDADPNRLSVVALARFRRFELLLTGDAEAEAAPVEPGSVDVLKLAHHGSSDGGLGVLLDRARPEVAVASVGEGNRFGHPHPDTTTTLAERGIPLLRTDEHGEVVIAVDGGDFSVAGTG